MTREEAIERIEGLYGIAKHESLDDEEDKEAIDMAIKLLEQGSILDEVRAEIIELRKKRNVGVLECLDIIDKYRESEDKR